MPKKNDEIDMAKKIVELLDSPELRKKMGEFGRNRVLNELGMEIRSTKTFTGI